MAEREQGRREDPDAYRMTLGEHLDELRGSVIRSLLALVLISIACIWPAKYLLEIIARPMVLALRRHGQQESFLQTSPVEGIVVYIKVVVIFGLIFSAPYILWQLWKFAAVGLYKHERRWVYRLFPPSIALFLTGVIFMYAIVLVVSLNFLVGFAGWLPLPDPEPTVMERALLGIKDEQVPETQPTVESSPAIPLLTKDPNNPPVGAAWVNVPEGRLKIRYPNNTYSARLQRDDKRALMAPHFKIGEYLSFVLILTIAFGVAFQMPLVVIFLVRIGIVKVETLRKYRKIVILLIVIIAGILAPPDLLSHLLLSGPMIILFEIGLLFAGRTPKPKPTTDLAPRE
jgi:sec-independent protein translocase protein TatC